MPLFIPEYQSLTVHKLMLSDKSRTNAFCRAIASKIKIDSTAIDLGAGTGILSLATVKAGAKLVYAIERSGIAAVADRLFSKNHFDEKIRLLVSDAKHAIISERVDLLLSECIGVHVFQENMLLDFIDSRDRYLKPGGTLIPEAIDIWLAPLKHNPMLDKEILKWNEPVYGFDFREISRLSLNDTYIAHISPEDLAAPGTSALTLDLYTLQPADSFRISAVFSPETAQSITGICGWFTAHLTKDIALDTSPSSPLTHWQQTVYPIYPEIKIDKGEELQLEILFEPADSFVHMTWTAFVIERKEETFREFSTKNNYTLPEAHSVNEPLMR